MRFLSEGKTGWEIGQIMGIGDATARFYVDNAAVGDVEGLTRAVIIFDGNDAEAVETARSGWKRFRGAGHEVSYWQQDDQGRWQNKAA